LSYPADVNESLRHLLAGLAANALLLRTERSMSQRQLAKVARVKFSAIENGTPTLRIS
jgi:transcriptional regulator with XRE-family HTH domain